MTRAGTIGRDADAHTPMTPPDLIAEFKVRPSLDGSGRPLIEFLGDHRAPGFPSVLLALGQGLPAFESEGHWPAPDDFLWQCRFDGGAFEVSEDWAGRFIIADDDAHRVIELVADALVRSGHFRRVAPHDAEPGLENVN